MLRGAVITASGRDGYAEGIVITIPDGDGCSEGAVITASGRDGYAEGIVITRRCDIP